MLGLVVILSFVCAILGLACFIQHKVNQRLGREVMGLLYNYHPELFKPKYENNVVDLRDKISKEIEDEENELESNT